jgi:hypothetical protein
VFWYKAALRKNFRCGSPALWQFHQRHYNPKALVQGTGGVPLARKPGTSSVTVKKLGAAPAQTAKKPGGY